MVALSPIKFCFWKIKACWMPICLPNSEQMLKNPTLFVELCLEANVTECYRNFSRLTSPAVVSQQELNEFVQLLWSLLPQQFNGLSCLLTFETNRKKTQRQHLLAFYDRRVILYHSISILLVQNSRTFPCWLLINSVARYGSNDVSSPQNLSVFFGHHMLHGSVLRKLTLLYKYAKLIQQAEDLLED
jgi:hypothetical protein